MRTVVSSAARTVEVTPDGATIIVGERINPTGRKRLGAALLKGDLAFLEKEARAQVEAGADIIDVNVALAGVNEVDVLPRAVQVVAAAVPTPISIDSPNPESLRAALRVYQGKALVNSVTAEDTSLERVLPLVKEFGAVVVGLLQGNQGIPEEPAARLELAKKILGACENYGIPPEDVLIDCVALPACTNPRNTTIALETIGLVRRELGVNLTMGVSNISYGMPSRQTINAAFLAQALPHGLNCPIVDPTVPEIALTIRALDYMLGKDEYALRYINTYRGIQKRQEKA